KWSFATGGTKEVWAEVKDDVGQTDKDSANIYAIENQPPVALFTYSPEKPKAGEWVTFDASSSDDPDGKTVLFEWDWGNNGVINDRLQDPEITYYWDRSHTYQVRLIVTDNHGATNSVTKDIIIEEESFVEKIKGWWPWSKELRTISEDEFKQIKSELNIYNYPYPYPEEDYADPFSDMRANPDSNVNLYWYTDYDLKNALDKEIGEEAPGLTYGIYILNAINEREMVEYVWTQEYKQRASTFFNAMLDMSTGWSSVATDATENLLTGLLHEPYSSGASTLLLSYDIAQVGIYVGILKKLYFYNALWYYLQERASGSTHGDAWKSVQRFGCEPNCAPQDCRIPAKGLFESEAEYEKKLNALEVYYKNLWDVYGEALKHDQLDEFRYELKNKIREILYSVLQRHKPELLDWQVMGAKSPIELRVYDSQGNVTGVVSGEAKEEIMYSVYGDRIKSVVIFCPSDSYRYEVVGTEAGTYGLEITSIEDGKVINFTATDIPTSTTAIHQYTIDWDVLSKGEEGVTVQIDSDGDGVFEQTVTADNTFQLPIASFTYSPAHPVINQTITFNASSSYDLDGNIRKYEWNFGDGNIMNTTEEIITHAYASAGYYTVNLTVTDNDGATSTDTQSIFVNRIQKGISYAAWWHDTYATNDSDTSLENLKDTCTEWVSLVVTWYQDNASSTEIYRDDNRTPTDDSLIHAINKIHSLNMSVMLKPTVDLQDENWRGNINFDNIAYSDALGLGWQDWSWDCNRNFESTTSVHRGKYAINVSFEPWGGLSFANPEGVNTDRYDILEFYINGGERGGQQLRLSVTDDKGNELPSSGGKSINNPKYVHDGIISAKTWKLVSVPLEDLNATNTKIIKINIMDNTGHAQPALYIDDVMLTAPQSKWNEWFSSYEQFILHYADLAEKNNCEQFCVGVEYKGTVQRENNWRDIIEKVKEHYTGPITYASNWDNYQNINWWDASALDFVGIDAYFPLTEESDPSVEELKGGWKKWEEEIESWQQRVNKSIIFTEIGYCSLDGTNIEPWNWTYSDIVDLQEQADCYNATFQTFWNKPWLAGIYLWMWDTDPDVGGPLDKSYTPYKKPAEGAVKKYYCAEKVSFLHKERLIGGPV
ncbi:MAG: PKD domain-containing protein, partial [Methanophagales archaeon]|nr:PKD domain-containing protein [Methanophagales archaeon]